jgi:outer membrane protein OmpA-like peptidoglycan-associated protein
MALPADPLPQVDPQAGDQQAGASPESEASPELGLLKRLLFRNEQTRLDALQDRTEALAARVGDNARLEKATADVLAGALRRAEVADHRALSLAIAPLVVAAIRSEIVNSRDVMVEALYPITGRLVSAAVAAAFRDLVATINARLDQLLSTQIWRLRLRAVLTGRPISEILLEAAQRPEVRLMMALERDSGRLLASWRAQESIKEPAQEHAQEHPNESPELVGGMIAAISQFATEAFSGEHGELRTLDMGASRILLRASLRLIVAAEFMGVPHPGDEQRMDRALYALIEDSPEGPTNDGLARLAADFASPPERKSSGKLKLALVLMALLAAFGLWRGPVRNFVWEWRLNEAYGNAVAGQAGLAAWPLQLSLDRGAKIARIRGLAPPDADLDAVSKAVGEAGTPYRVETRVARVATSAGLETEAQAQRGQAAALKGAVEGLAGRLDGSDRWQAAREAEAHAPARALAQLAGATSIAFGDDLDYADPERAKSQIAALAAQLKASGLGLRVLGYSDQKGSPAQNLKLSQQRADHVLAELVAEGVESSKLVSVGRSAEAAIAAPGGPQSRQNRRVAFEMLTPTEP